MKRHFVLISIVVILSLPRTSWARAFALCGCYNGVTGQQMALGWDVVQVPGLAGTQKNVMTYEAFYALRNATNFYNTWVISHRLACQIINTQLDQMRYCVFAVQPN